MLMKDVMLEKGIIDEDAQSVTCPSCDCSGLDDPVNKKFISELNHEEPCLYVNACRDIGISPYSEESVKKAMDGVFVIASLFNPTT